MCYYARLLGATFCSGPPGIPDHVYSPPTPTSLPDFSNTTVSVTLAHSWDSGCLLPRADIPYPLGLARRQPAQISWPSFLLCMEGPGLEQRLRGWNGDRGEGGGEQEGTFEPVFPFTASSPLVLFLLIMGASGARLARSEVRGEIQSADKY